MNYYTLMKKRCSSAGWAMCIYTLILYASVFAYMFAVILIHSIEAELSDLSITAGEQEALLSSLESDAWGYFIAIAIGMVALLLWKKKKFTFGTIFHQGKPMTLGSFLTLICLANCAQLFFMLFANLLEFLLNPFGYTSLPAVDAASMTADTISMFLYAGILAPVFEEIFFRGAAMRHLQPYGKQLAVFGSAFAFGMFHGNIVQSPFAFLVGLIYGYTAMEFSIFWAMALHMFNNLVLGDSLYRLGMYLGESTYNMIFSLMIYGSVLVSIVVLIVRRKAVEAWFRENRMAPGSLKAFFLAPGMIVFNIIMAVFMLLSITPLP